MTTVGNDGVQGGKAAALPTRTRRCIRPTLFLAGGFCVRCWGKAHGRNHHGRRLRLAGGGAVLGVSAVEGGQ